MSDPAAEHARRIAEPAREQGRSVASAESLTSGRVAASLGAAKDAATWFRGGLVAYHDEVTCRQLALDGDPDEVVEASTLAAVELLRRTLESAR